MKDDVITGAQALLLIELAESKLPRGVPQAFTTALATAKLMEDRGWIELHWIGQQKPGAIITDRGRNFLAKIAAAFPHS
jgi:hypothetical protein